MLDNTDYDITQLDTPPVRHNLLRNRLLATGRTVTARGRVVASNVSTIPQRKNSDDDID